MICTGSLGVYGLVVFVRQLLGESEPLTVWVLFPAMLFIGLAGWLTSFAILLPFTGVKTDESTLVAWTHLFARRFERHEVSHVGAELVRSGFSTAFRLRVHCRDGTSKKVKLVGYSARPAITESLAKALTAWAQRAATEHA